MTDKIKNTKILKCSKKIKLLNKIGGKCSKCYETNIFKLTFHHINDKKDFEFSDMKNYRLSIIEKEIDKCIILCQNCHREHHYYVNNSEDKRRSSKLVYLEYGGTECIKCGYNKCPAVLSFHHRNPNEKEFMIGALSERLNSLDELNDMIKKEIDKCDVLCANCHVLEHSDIDFYEKYRREIEDKVINYKEIQSKIDRDIVMEMYNNGTKQIDIAKYFNASKGTISDIIKKYKVSKP